jgi:hypothetical protein
MKEQIEMADPFRQFVAGDSYESRKKYWHGRQKLTPALNAAWTYQNGLIRRDRQMEH